ncbi:MAG: hypothetical protein KBA46_04290 [Candidatus Omnitrophica bacterium]|nr:hypothetical protein [Candidatus Omnitrophota bacterium]
MEYARKDTYKKPHTPAEVLKLALAKEKSSFKFYDSLLKDTSNPALVRMIKELRSAEWGHIQKIMHKMQR